MDVVETRTSFLFVCNSERTVHIALGLASRTELVGRLAAFLICIFSGGASFIPHLTHISLRSLSDHERFVGIYHHHIYTAERAQAHSHVESNYSFMFSSTFGRGTGLGGHLIFVCYISRHATSISGFRCAAFIFLFCDHGKRTYCGVFKGGVIIKYVFQATDSGMGMAMERSILRHPMFLGCVYRCKVCQRLWS